MGYCANVHMRYIHNDVLQFNRDCIDEWIRSGHSVCPIEGNSAITKTKKNTQALNKDRGTTVSVPMTRDDEVRFSISGQGLGADLPPERIDTKPTFRGTSA